MEILTNNNLPNPDITSEMICFCYRPTLNGRSESICRNISCGKIVLMNSFKCEYKKCLCAQPKSSILFNCEICFGWVPSTSGKIRFESAMGMMRALAVNRKMLEEELQHLQEGGSLRINVQEVGQYVVSLANHIKVMEF